MARAPLEAFRHSFVQASDVRIHVVHSGEDGRQPMVLLHGIGMDWRVWQAVSRRLRPHFGLYLLDLRGHGSSEKPVRGYTLPHYAADVEDVLDSLGLSDVVLVGSSLGGMVAATAEAPADVVSRRVLVDPPLTGGPVRDPDTFRMILDLKHGPPGPLAEYLSALNPGIGRHLAGVMEEMWREAADGVITEMLADSGGYFAIDGALRAIPSPTLLMAADPTMAPALTPEGTGRALTLLPDAQAVTVYGAGHAIHATRPAEFVQSILNFVALAA